MHVVCWFSARPTPFPEPHPQALNPHPKLQVVQVVCCRLTPLQDTLYRHFLESKAAARLILAAAREGGGGGRASGVLSAITRLKKLCNHPKLIYDEGACVLGERKRGSRGGWWCC
jgi:SNF2 family DNA or RNA helicase